MAVSQTIQEEVLKEANSATPNYEIDYNDPRFGKVESDKTQALTELEQTYDGMIDSTDKFYDDLKNANQQWADKQAQIQQEQTDFAIEKIEQQKEQAEKDYIKEQSGAYVDYKKQSSKFGTQAEKLAGAGLTDTGYAESSQVSMYNTYQMRVTTARDALERAKLNFDNNIKEAMLQNNAALAEIYANAFIKQSELALEGFQYKNELVLEKANKQIELENIYYNRWQDTLQQINTENALKEDIRQYNETMKWNTEQNELDRKHQSAENELNRKQQAAIAQAELDYKAKKDALDRRHDYAYLIAKTAADKAVIDKQYEIDKKKIEEEKNAAIAKINAQAAADQATYSYKHDLDNKSSGGVGDDVVDGVVDDIGGIPDVDAPIGIVEEDEPIEDEPIEDKPIDTTKKTTKTTNYEQAQNEKFAQKKGSFIGTTYDDAVSYLKLKGVPSSYRTGLMTQSEWSRRKQSYSMTGMGNAAVKNYSSYSAYLQAYVNSCVAYAK